MFISVKDFSAGYGANNIIKDISFEAEKGTVTGILGETGCGKTTLVKALCHIIPSEGEFLLDGEDVSTFGTKLLARNISYIPQKSGLGLDISAMDVVLMGFNSRLPLLGKPGKKMVSEALSALEKVGMSEFAEKNFMKLSEGQKQLIIFARAIVSNGKLMLLDEPESALDINKRHNLMRLIKDWVADEKSAMVVLHDPTLALNYCEQLLLLKDGRVNAIIHPKTDSLADMEAQLALIYGEVTLKKVADKKGSEKLVMLGE